MIAVPPSADRFVGRSADLRLLSQLLARERLVTIAGPGGVGKSRIAAEQIASRARRWPGGVVWIDLVPVTEDSSARLLIAKGAEELREGPSLVVLDNCEHILLGAKDGVTALLTGRADVTILATSREPLGITAEFVHRVPPLSAAEATELLIERTRRHDSAFSPQGPDLMALAELADRLDRLPLPIELAAPWVATLGPQSVLDGVGPAPNELASGTTGHRHSSLKAVVDLSHALLSGPERIVFRRLAVFPGRLDPASVVAVCSLSVLDESEIVGAFAGLVRSSLVAAERDSDGSTVHRVLQTIRTYAAERLDASGEGERVIQAFCAHYSSLGRRIFEAKHDERQEAFLRLTHREMDSLMAAVELLFERDPREAMALGGAIGWFATATRRSAELGVLLERTLAAVPGDTSERARAHQVAGIIADAQGDTSRGLTHAREAARIGEKVGEGLRIAFSLSVLGGHPGVPTDERRQCLIQAIALAEEIGEDVVLATALANLVDLMLESGDLPAATDTARRAVSIMRRKRVRLNLAQALARLSVVEAMLRHGDAARAAISEAITIVREFHLHTYAPWMLKVAAAAAAVQHDFETAIRLSAAADSLGVTIGSDIDPFPADLESAIRDAHRHVRTSARLARAAASLTLDQALELASSELPSAAPAQLGERRRQVLELISSGHTNKEVATKLTLSVRTVDWHVEELMNLAGVNTRTALAAWAAAAGYSGTNP